MTYIVVALKSEAQAFVDKFKLNKEKQNENIYIKTSGIGADNMYKTTKEVLNIMKPGDIIVNVGICGADKKYKVGELLDARDINLTCVDYEVSHNNYDVVDMESKGFIEATQNSPYKSYMFKIVSDNFEPKSVSKDMAKKLIFDKIDEIMEKIV
jgi:nucleoside phosphorylase